MFKLTRLTSKLSFYSRASRLLIVTTFTVSLIGMNTWTDVLLQVICSKLTKGFTGCSKVSQVQCTNNKYLFIEFEVNMSYAAYVKIMAVASILWLCLYIYIYIWSWKEVQHLNNSMSDSELWFRSVMLQGVCTQQDQWSHWLFRRRWTRARRFSL